MDGPKTSTNFSTIAVAQVIGYDPEHNSVYIRLASGQSPYLPARMLYKGNADQYRIEQEPLPLIGTWGVVAFPGEDDRFPIWLGAYYSTPQDAITSSNNLPDSQIKYMSHQSGYYNLLDGTGNYYARFPEGTDIRVSATNTPPPTYRHVVDPNIISQYGTPQIQVQFQNPERVPNPPPSFYVSINHSSGAFIQITPSGTITISGVSKNVLTIDQTGNISLMLSQTANINLQTNSSGSNINLNANGSGSILNLSSPNGEILFTAPPPTGGTKAAGIDDIKHMWSLFNTHTHGGVQSGTSNTNAPNSPYLMGNEG